MEKASKPGRQKTVHVCAWCEDKEKRTKEEEAKGNLVSHGMCIECVKKWI